MPLDKTKDFFLGAIDGQRDPFRTTRWRVWVPGEVFNATGVPPTNGDSFGTLDGESDFSLNVKTSKIPDITVDTREIEYMGFKSFHPVNANISAEIDFETQMLEDMRAYEAVLAWQQSVLNTGVLVDGTNKDRMNQTGLELGLGNHKVATNPTAQVLRNQNVRVELYNWMTGDLILRLNLINAFPIRVTGPSLNAGNADLARFTFALKCDRWTVFIAPDYKTGKGAGTSAFGR